MTPAPADPSRRTALDDPGTAQRMLFLGWLPPAVTALVAGVIVALLTGDPWAFVTVLVAGTLVGYIVGLSLMFTVGFRLERRGVSASTAEKFVTFDFWSGVPVAIAVAVLALIAIPLALLALAVAIGCVVLGVAYLVITD
jgi:hypothetical protein